MAQPGNPATRSDRCWVILSAGTIASGPPDPGNSR